MTQTTTTRRLDEMPLERVEAEITQWSGNLAAGTALLLGWIAEYDRREGWKSWGCVSMAYWLSWKCGDSLHTAREKVRTARALEHLPNISAAFSAGEVSYSKVRALTRVATTADEADWLVQATHATGFQLERLVGATRRALKDENGDAAEAFAQRRVECVRSGASARLEVRGPADMVEAVQSAFETLASLIVDDAISGTDTRRVAAIAERGGFRAVRFDALAQMAERLVASQPAVAERGDVGRLQLVVDTDGLDELADGAEDAGAGGELTLSGRRIAPETVRRWTCDVRRSVVLEQSDHACDEGRTTRTVNRRLRRALHRRDHGMCRFPGCGAAQWLHAHHIVHWANGGPTSLDNLLSLCGFHHQLVHEGDWGVELVDDHVAWTDPTGAPVTIEPLCGSTAAVAEHASMWSVRADAVESSWTNDRLDFAFVVSVYAENIRARDRRRLRGDVPAGT